ncbi:hypothetical protein HBI22_193890 [Parastagonospora nodorum]|nr:hypothetical protein HBI22_193890 [Parastagonospora nodorum]
MLFRCSVVVVIFVGLGRCSTVPCYLYLPLRVLGARYWRVCCLGVISLASLGYLEQCSTVSCYLYLLLRVPGARY